MEGEKEIGNASDGIHPRFALLSFFAMRRRRMEKRGIGPGIRGLATFGISKQGTSSRLYFDFQSLLSLPSNSVYKGLIYLRSRPHHAYIECGVSKERIRLRKEGNKVVLLEIAFCAKPFDGLQLMYRKKNNSEKQLDRNRHSHSPARVLFLAFFFFPPPFRVRIPPRPNARDISLPHL